ncbi:MAG: hypothetical protein KGI98_15255 [Euryarchaeota archaeon]|nr:hypothetical protein [Euryarchaeota archaeon]
MMRIHAGLIRRGAKVALITVHRTLIRHGFMIRRVRKPEPISRFQRKHVDSLWQADVYDFRIKGGAGKVTSTPSWTTVHATC